jgi:hypothetical protein
MLSLGVRHGLTPERERSGLVCSLRNSRQAESQEAALRAAEALASRPAEALTAAMTLRLEELVDVMAVRTAPAVSEPETGIWRRGRACSLILAVLLTEELAELLIELVPELTALLAERLIELVVELAIGVTAHSATELAADLAIGSAHFQLLGYLSV